MPARSRLVPVRLALRLLAAALLLPLGPVGCSGGGKESGVASARLTVTRSGSGQGTVASAPAGIDCGASCSGTFTGGGVALAATPAAGSTFAGWSGACTGTGPTCVVTLAADAAVTARFEPASHTVTALVAGGGAGGILSTPAGIDCPGSCLLEVAHGAAVTLSASAAAGSSFLGWSGDCSGTGDCAVTANSDLVAAATFGLNPSLVVLRGGNGSGRVDSTPLGIACGASCSATYAHGAAVTLTATPDTGSTFTGWSGDCAGAAPCDLALDAPRLATASFALLPETLTVTLAGSGTGTVTSLPAAISCGATCQASLDHGASVVLVATPAVGSTFSGWSGGGCSGTLPCSVTMAAATSVTATFVKTQRTLTTVKTGGGAGSVTSSPAGINCGATCSGQFSDGSAVVLTAAAAAGSTFAGWSGGGCAGAAPCVPVLSADVTVTARFQLSQSVLAVTRTGLGTGTVTSNPAGISCGATCSALYNTGAVVVLTASAPNGSTFAGWSGGGCFGTGTCTVTLTGATAVSAQFN